MSKIAEIFAKDVLAWTPEDRDLAVAFYKENRDKFKLLDPKTLEPKTEAEMKKQKARARRVAKKTKGVTSKRRRKRVDPKQLDLDLNTSGKS
jgi:hypothetical protein